MLQRIASSSRLFFFVLLAAGKCLLSGCISASTSCRTSRHAPAHTHTLTDTCSANTNINMHTCAEKCLCLGPRTYCARLQPLQALLPLEKQGLQFHFNFLLLCLLCTQAKCSSSSSSIVSYLPRPAKVGATCLCACVCECMYMCVLFTQGLRFKMDLFDWQQADLSTSTHTEQIPHPSRSHPAITPSPLLHLSVCLSCTACHAEHMSYTLNAI